MCGDVMIPCCYDVIVEGNALDFVNISIFVNFLPLDATYAAMFGKKLSKKQLVMFQRVY